MGSVSAAVELLRTGVHLAGPRLTASRFSTGCARWARSAVRPTARSRRCGRRADRRASRGTFTTAARSTSSLGWWDPNATYTRRPADRRARRVAIRRQGSSPDERDVPTGAVELLRAGRGVDAFDTPRDARHARPAIRASGARRRSEPTLTADARASRAPRASSAPLLRAVPRSPRTSPTRSCCNDSGDYYAYSTGGPRGAVQAYDRRDLKHWSWLGAVLTTMPQWATGRSIWAPSVIRLGNRYVMYYAARDRGHRSVVSLVRGCAPPQRGVRRLQHRAVPVPVR